MQQKDIVKLLKRKMPEADGFVTRLYGLPHLEPPQVKEERTLTGRAHFIEHVLDLDAWRSWVAVGPLAPSIITERTSLSFLAHELTHHYETRTVLGLSLVLGRLKGSDTRVLSFASEGLARYAEAMAPGNIYEMSGEELVEKTRIDLLYAPIARYLKMRIASRLLERAPGELADFGKLADRHKFLIGRMMCPYLIGHRFVELLQRELGGKPETAFLLMTSHPPESYAEIFSPGSYLARCSVLSGARRLIEHGDPASVESEAAETAGRLMKGIERAEHARGFDLFGLEKSRMPDHLKDDRDC